MDLNFRQRRMVRSTATNIVTDQNGYIALETAIFLPIFIIGILTVALLIRVVAVEENVTFAAFDEGRGMAQAAAYMNINPIFPLQLQERVERENKEIYDYKTKKYSYLYSKGDISNLITYKAEYKVGLQLPLNIVDDPVISQSFTVRAFRGKDNSNTVFVNLEQEEKSIMVWVFPTWGTKYHKENCTYVRSQPFQMVLTNSIKSRYKSCKSCKPKDLAHGSTVYCFKYGGAYHRHSCNVVEKYVISMNEKDAKAKGYENCNKCGGR